MSIAADLANNRIAIVEAVDRLERAQRNDYTQLRAEIREIQNDIIGGLAAMRRTVAANEIIAAGVSTGIENTLGRRLDGIEASLRTLVQQLGTNGSGGHVG